MLAVGIRPLRAARSRVWPPCASIAGRDAAPPPGRRRPSASPSRPRQTGWTSDTERQARERPPANIKLQTWNPYFIYRKPKKDRRTCVAVASASGPLQAAGLGHVGLQMPGEDVGARPEEIAAPDRGRREEGVAGDRGVGHRRRVQVPQVHPHVRRHRHAAPAPPPRPRPTHVSRVTLDCINKAEVYSKCTITALF